MSKLLDKLLSVSKPIKIAAIVGNIVLILLLVLTCLLPALNVSTNSYAGWEVIFFGPAQNFAYGQYNFSTNWFLAVVLPLAVIAILVTDYEWRDMAKTVKLVFMGIGAVCLLLTAIGLFTLSAAATVNASEAMARTIQYAKADGMFSVGALPVISGIFALLQVIILAAAWVCVFFGDSKQPVAEQAAVSEEAPAESANATEEE